MHGLEVVSAVFAVSLVTLSAFSDWRIQRVSNTLTLPLLGGALLARLAWAFLGADWPALGWGLLGAVLLQAAWVWGYLGGADAKAFAGLWLLWPTPTWLILWLTAVAGGYVLWQQARRIPALVRRLPSAFPALCPVALGAWVYVVGIACLDSVTVRI